MKQYNKITPDGTRDLLFDECVQRANVAGRLGEMFASRGYRQVITPALEYYDLFTSSSAHFPQENMYKLSDTHGRLMVLRPDCTIPIARLVAARLQSQPVPIRLYYSQSVYRVEHELRGHSSEIFQTGVELIGAGSLRGDLEIVELASAGLGEICGEAFRIELCHIGYFKALIDSLQVDAAEKEEIRQCIEHKNYAALSDLLEPYENDRAAAALKFLPRLFGGEEVFEQAYALFDGNGAGESLDHLRGIYEHLCTLGLADRVIIDLGLVNQAEYYTGIIFRGYADGVGEPVLSGGRYDNLLGEFGMPMAATGFAFHVDAAATVAERTSAPGVNILVFADDHHLPEAINYMKSLTQNGLVVENCVFDEFDAAVDYARKRGIRQIHVVDETIETLDVAKL